MEMCEEQTPPANAAADLLVVGGVGACTVGFAAPAAAHDGKSGGGDMGGLVRLRRRRQQGPQRGIEDGARGFPKASCPPPLGWGDRPCGGRGGTARRGVFPIELRTSGPCVGRMSDGSGRGLARGSLWFVGWLTMAPGQSARGGACHPPLGWRASIPIVAMPPLPLLPIPGQDRRRRRQSDRSSRASR